MLKNLLVLVAVVIFIIAGCYKPTGSLAGTESLIETQTPVPQATLSIDYPAPVETAMAPIEAYPAPPTLEVSLSPYPEPEESGILVPVEPAPIKVDLVASDPALVNLTSGTPTFVEFFAFW